MPEIPSAPRLVVEAPRGVSTGGEGRSEQWCVISECRSSRAIALSPTRCHGQRTKEIEMPTYRRTAIVVGVLLIACSAASTYRLHNGC